LALANVTDHDHQAVADDGDYVHPYLVCRRCHEPLRRKPGGKHWRCTCQVETSKPTSYTDGWLAHLEELGMLNAESNR
jgi:hypothetical protein